MYNFILFILSTCCYLNIITPNAGAAPQNNNTTTEQLQNIVDNYSTVLVYEDGEVLLTLCNPEDGDCVQAYLNVHDCDEYNSCLFYHED